MVQDKAAWKQLSNARTQAARAVASARKRIEAAIRSRATTLSLHNLELEELPPEIGRIATLRQLDLSKNQLAQIPKEIGELRNLHALDLSFNAFSSIPIESTAVPALEILDISFNRLVDLPREIQQLSSLQSLDVSGNQIADLPSEISQLPKLRRLYLSGNSFSEIPAIVSELSGIHWLSFSRNKISSVPDFSRLIRLIHLDMSRCGLDQLPISITQLHSLRSLDLSANRLKTLPAEIGLLTQLHTLNVPRNQLSKLPPEMGALRALTRLSLVQNQLTTLPAQIGELRSLEVVATNPSKPPGFGIHLEANPLSDPLPALVKLHQPDSTVSVLRYLRGELESGEIKRLSEALEEQRGSLEKHLAKSVSAPSEPLPSDRPAVRFAVVDGKVTLSRPRNWKGNEAHVAHYQKAATEIATRLSARVGNNAPRELTVALESLLNVLRSEVRELQPHLLRTAYRSIGARARVYSHPEAQWELLPDAVGDLFELVDVLNDLQALAGPELEAHERAIRGLELSENNLPSVSKAHDELADLVSASEAVLPPAALAFETGRQAASSATDGNVKHGITGDRVLTAENLITALARALDKIEAIETRGREEASQSKSEAIRLRDSHDAIDETPRRRSTFNEITERILNRIKLKAPEKLADALTDAAVKMIKAAPTTIAAFAGAIVLWTLASPAIAIGASGAVGAGWLAYKVYKRMSARKR